jgi:diguanylate cyclase (GGDEF)-like protein
MARVDYVSTDSKRWVGVAVGLTLAEIVASALLPRGIELTAISDILCSLLLFALLLAFAGNARFSQGRLRSVWILLAVCWIFWLIDLAGWMLFDVVLRKPLPEMFPGDVILFLAGVPMLACLLLRPHLEPSHDSVRLGLVDFLQLMLWWIYLYVYLVMCWQYVSPNADLYNRNYDWLYLVEVLVQAIVLSLLLKQSAGAWRRFYALLLGAVAFNYLSILAENRAIEAKLYYNGSWYDTPFMASLAFFMIVAVKGRDLTPAPETAGDRKYSSWMASLAGMAVLSLPVIIAISVMDRWAPPEIVRFRVIITAVTMLVITVLAFVKQRRLHEDLKQANKILEQASMTDPLTGIWNRRFFTATVAGDVAQTLRSFAEAHDPLTRDLIFYLIDLDNFKEVNDVYGHDAGDRVLVETARRIGSVIRDSDVLLRWGGEEFLIVSRSTDRREADALATRVMQAIRGDLFAVSTSQQIRRTCSIGWAAFPWIEDNVEAKGYEEVLNLADRALGQAKQAGKDRAIGMTPLQAEADSAMNLRSEPHSLPVKT